MSVRATKDEFVPSGGGAVTLYSGFGKILAIIMSTEETAGVQTVSFRDGLTSTSDILLDIRCPQSQPYSLFFTSNRALTFSTGLTIVPGNCNVHVTLLAK
jgi:hypothetical protein